MTNDARDTYLATIDVALALLDAPVLDARWNTSSALEGYTCGALAGHLVRSLLTVDTYLDQQVPATRELLDAPTYFAHALGDDDPVTSAKHVAVRERSADLAGADAAALRTQASVLRDRLRVRLPHEPAGASITVFGGLVMPVDAYLDTRIVELLVHVDDLAVSLDLPTPAFPAEAAQRAVAITAELARRRHGDLAVLRALTRAERTSGSVTAF